ncbi:TPA: hypothetical protein N0F65_009316 [Lagenidium giganteum]|uniref:Uncharacterized protein n=1 Tax=Lagenidium giganteum TaxID=4803 RepID=A0AAV2YQP7_9STRA|nr:TPA: hypothetical protein N0F65_009316 [Lagenidium giganteum]
MATRVGQPHAAVAASRVAADRCCRDAQRLLLGPHQRQSCGDVVALSQAAAAHRSLDSRPSPLSTTAVRVRAQQGVRESKLPGAGAVGDAMVVSDLACAAGGHHCKCFPQCRCVCAT